MSAALTLAAYVDLLPGIRTPHFSLQSERGIGQGGVHNLFCRQAIRKTFHVGMVDEIEYTRMRNARFENLHEPIDFLLRPVLRHDCANKLDELIAGMVTRAHHTSLMIVGVQYLCMIPGRYNHQVVQIVDAAAMLNRFYVVEDVLVIPSHGLLVRHKWCPAGSHTCPV